MEANSLQLFNKEELDPHILNASINTSKPSIPPEDRRVELTPYNPQKTLESTLNSILPDSQEENKLMKARKIMGETIKDVPDEQLQVFVTELQYLIDTFLDNFEKQVFDGLTLKQLLREG